MADIARVERELSTVNSLLESANFTSSARPHLEELKRTLERELLSIRELQVKAASAGRD